LPGRSRNCRFGILERGPCKKREAQRSSELMRLAGRLTPDFKTIAKFREDNGTGATQRIIRSIKKANLTRLAFL